VTIWPNIIFSLIRLERLFGTEIELENIGGIRSELISGKITRGDLATMDPFKQYRSHLQIKGKMLKEILLKFRPAVSGIQYRIGNNRLEKATIGGRPIEDAHLYTGATNSFAAGTVLKDIAFKNTNNQRLEVVIDSIRKKGRVKPVYDGRRVIMD